MKNPFFLVILLSTVLLSVSCSDDKGEEEKPTIPVIEMGNESTNVTLPETGTGTATVSFTSNMAWQVITSDTRAVPSWFDVSPKSGGAGTQTLTVTLKEENTGYDDRTGYIRIVSGDVEKYITVTQKKKEALLITQSRYEVDMSGEQIEVEVKANIEFNVDIKNPEWISQIGTRALTTSKLRFTISANEDADSREGQIVISSGNLTETVTVYQAGGEVLVLTQNEYTVPDTGETIQIEVRCNTEYTVEMMPKADWIKEAPDRAISAYTKYYEITPNETYDSRSVTLVFSTATKREEVTVTQLQKDAIILAKSEYEFDLSGGKLTFNVQHNVDLDVAIDESGKDWITQVTTRSLQTTTLNFQIAEHIGKEERSGQIVLSKGDSLKQTITIRQSGIGSELLTKEREALIAIYNATGGNNWTNNINWCSEKPVGEWHGVSVNEDGFVTALDIDDKNLTGNIPAEIGYLTKLERLQVSGVTLPEEIGNCTNLLGLFASFLSGTLPASLGNLTKLKALSIDGSNGLTGFIPNSIGNLTDLEQLEFNWCSFSGTIPPEIGLLSKLKTLYIVDCGISGEIPAEIGNCKQLVDMNLNSNRLSGIIPGQVGSLSNLKYLVLYGNMLSGEIPKSLQQNKFCWETCWAYIINENNFDLSSTTIKAVNFNVRDINGNSIVAANEYSKNTYTVLFQFSPLLNDYTNIDNLKRIYDTYAGKGIDIIGYSRSEEAHGGSIESIRQYISKNNIPWTNIALSENNELIKPDEQVSWPYSIYYPYHSYPFITLVNSNGEVVFYSDYKDGNFSGLDKFLNDNVGGGNIPAYYTSTDYSADGEVLKLQKATEGNGIDIVLVGDAFSDRLIADGTYERMMRKGMDAFFAEEPYRSHRNMFNVYAVYAVSANEVYDDYSITALEGYFGEGTLVGGDDEKCFAYAGKAVSDTRMNDALLIVIMNSENYGGTCYMYYLPDGDYGRGPSIAYFPKGSDDATLEGLLHHEAGGHGFARLGDEYSYQSQGAMPDDEIESYREDEVYGWWKNVDFTSDPAQVKWAKFLMDTRYAKEELGVYEGACTYWTGAYRPAESSIMDANYGGFNAPSREAIYYRIHKLAYGAKWDYNYEDFVAYDVRNRTAAALAARREQAGKAAARAQTFRPQTPPVVIRRSWREAK